MHRQTGEGREGNRQDRWRIGGGCDHDQVPLAGDSHLNRLRARLELRPQGLGFELAVARLVADQARLIGALARRQVKTGAVVEEDGDLCCCDHEQHEQADCE